jgi:hypothetical protein
MRSDIGKPFHEPLLIGALSYCSRSSAASAFGICPYSGIIGHPFFCRASRGSRDRPQHVPALPRMCSVGAPPRNSLAETSYRRSVPSRAAASRVAVRTASACRSDSGESRAVNARCAAVGFLDANLPLIFVLSDVYQRRSVHAVA